MHIARPARHGIGIFDADVWSAARVEAFKQSEQLLSQASAEGCTLVVVDDNMHLRSMRREYYQLAAKAGAAFVLVEVTSMA